MNEITRCLNELQIIQITWLRISKMTEGTCLRIFCQKRQLTISTMECFRTVLVSGIHITSTHTLHHIDKVEFHNTCDISPFILTSSLSKLLLDFQIDTRCQCYFVMADTIIAVPIPWFVILPLIIGRCPVCFKFIFIRIGFTNSCIIYICCCFNIFCEEHIARQITQEFDRVINTEIVTMLFVLFIRIIGL